MATRRQAVGWVFVCALVWAAGSAHAIEILAMEPYIGSSYDVVRGIPHTHFAHTDKTFDKLKWCCVGKLLGVTYQPTPESEDTMAMFTYAYEEWGSVNGIDAWLRVKAFKGTESVGAGYWVKHWANLGRRASESVTITEGFRPGENATFSMTYTVPNSNYRILSLQYMYDGEVYAEYDGGSGTSQGTLYVQNLPVPSNPEAMEWIADAVVMVWELTMEIRARQSQIEGRWWTHGTVTANLACNADLTPLGTWVDEENWSIPYKNRGQARWDPKNPEEYNDSDGRDTDTEGDIEFPVVPTDLEIKVKAVSAASLHYHDGSEVLKSVIYTQETTPVELSLPSARDRWWIFSRQPTGSGGTHLMQGVVQ